MLLDQPCTAVDIAPGTNKTHADPSCNAFEDFQARMCHVDPNCVSKKLVGRLETQISCTCQTLNALKNSADFFCTLLVVFSGSSILVRKCWTLKVILFAVC